MKIKIITQFYSLDNVGKPTFRKEFIKDSCYKRKVEELIYHIEYENVLVLKYIHRRTRGVILDVVKDFPNIEYLSISKNKVIFLSEKDSYDGIEMIRGLVENRIWEKM